MQNAHNIASSFVPSRAIVTKRINTQVLDSRKHQAIHHKDGEHSPILFAAIVGELDTNDHSGCGSRAFIRSTREYLREQRVDIMAFDESRISRFAADKVINDLQFLHSFRVEVDGFFGGIWLCWFDNVTIEILFSHFQFIHCRTQTKADGKSALFTFVYASLNQTKRKHL
ncbi:hypothetical protein V6N13_050935 [Hibiscus sabdariffa]